MHDYIYCPRVDMTRDNLAFLQRHNNDVNVAMPRYCEFAI